MNPTGPAAATDAPASATTITNHAYIDGVTTPSRNTAATIANDAPALTPRMVGDASALRVTACITPPATASAAPTPRPISVRGSRSDRTMRCSFEPSNAVNAATAVAVSSSTEPTRRLATATTPNPTTASSSPAERVVNPERRRRGRLRRQPP